jgi:hypothetical protein
MTGNWWLKNSPGFTKMRDPESGSFITRNKRDILRTIIILAVLARIASALYQGNEVEALPGVADQISYHRLSIRVLEGHGFSFDVGWWPATPAGQPTAHWSYLYVLFISGVYALFGPNPIAARVIQAVLAGVLQPLLVCRIGSRLFGLRVGLISAAFSAAYAYFVFYGGALMTESFYMVAILWILDIATTMTSRIDRQAGTKEVLSWLLLGLACASAVLLRQVFLLLVPVVLLWLAWELVYLKRLLSGRQILVRFAAATTVLAGCIAPWTFRNYRAFDTFVLLNTNSGFAFFWGNHPIHGTSFIPILDSATYGSLIPPELRGLNEAEMDKALLKQGLDFVRQDPVRYLRLSASRIREYFKFWPSGDSSTISNLTRILSSGVFLPLAAGGQLLLLFSYVKDKGRSFRSSIPGTSLLLIIGALYTLLHVMTWTLVRYRLPVDAVFMPFAALSIVAGYDYLTNKMSTRCPENHS